jgi:hypothetical protein
VRGKKCLPDGLIRRFIGRSTPNNFDEAASDPCARRTLDHEHVVPGGESKPNQSEQRFHEPRVGRERASLGADLPPINRGREVKYRG